LPTVYYILIQYKYPNEHKLLDLKEQSTVTLENVQNKRTSRRQRKQADVNKP